jgi:regulator of replication initiation timing
MSIFKDLSNVFTGDLNRRIRGLNRRIKGLELDLECLRQELSNREDEIGTLKLQNFALKLRLSQSHLRDPKTGRIMPKGKHIV